METKYKLESILLYKGQPVPYAELSKAVGLDAEEVKAAIRQLAAEHEGKGTRIVFGDHECELVTSPEAAELIAGFQKQDTETELSPAALETLSIVLYMGPIARNMIDYVRGVNSQFTVRNLLVRGLIERDPASKSSKYVVSLDTIKFLGLNSITELPNYKEVRHSISEFIKEHSHESRD